jgi:poly(A) polymerase
MGIRSRAFLQKSLAGFPPTPEMTDAQTSMKEVAALLKPLTKSLKPGTHWIVGGLLRDAALGRPLNDVDIAVKGDALASAKKLGAAFKQKPFPLDAKRGIYRVVQKKAQGSLTFDFSKLQGKTLKDDLQRRDFTVNAIALPLEKLAAGDWKTNADDPFGGFADLRARKLRVVRESALEEDPLRLLRAFRLSAELSFAIEEKTLALIRKHRGLISRSAAERVRDELCKIFATPVSGRVAGDMDRAGLLTVIFPEGEAMRKTAHAYYGKEGVLGHSLQALASFDKLMTELGGFFPAFHKPLQAYLQESVSGYPRYVLLKLVELLHDVGKPDTAKVEKGKLHFHGHDYVGKEIASKIAERLRLSNEETRSLGRMVQAHMRPGNLSHQPVLTDKAVYRFYRDLENDAIGMLLVALADHFTYLSDAQRRSGKDPVFLTIKKMLSKHFSRPETVHPPKIIDGGVLMSKLDLTEGPLIGRLLGAVREAQAAGKVKTREQAVQFAGKLLKDNKFRARASVPEDRRLERL